MLEIKGIDVYYGAIKALKNISLTVEKGEIIAIIGSNGAGKSTLLRTISGTLKPRVGNLFFEGREITDMPADQRVHAKISHSPEGRQIFTNMCVLENLQLGAYARHHENWNKELEEILVQLPRLKERLHQNAGTLSGGEQQLLAMGRAMMNQPKLLLLDEPSLGLAPNRVTEIFKVIQDIHQKGTTIILVEQNAHLALEIADQGYVLETGSIVLSGAGKDLLNNEKVKEAYLGGA